MREIKFRAYNKKHWYMTWYVSIKDIEDWFKWLYWNASDDVIVMQYTWLKDRCWKEVYEGDIVVPFYWSYPWYRLIVQYLAVPNPWFKLVEKLWDSPEEWFWDFEVIWNIYENVELLK